MKHQEISGNITKIRAGKFYGHKDVKCDIKRKDQYNQTNNLFELWKDTDWTHDSKLNRQETHKYGHMRWVYY